MKKPLSGWSRAFWLVVAVQLAVMGLLGVMILRRDRNPIVIEPSRQAWSSGTIRELPAEGDMTISRENLLADFDALSGQWVTAGRRAGSITALIGLVGDLSRSGYTISVEYSCGSEQGISYDCLNARTMLMAQGRLIPGTHRTADFDVYAFLPSQNFRIFFDYDGSGSLTVHRVTLRTNSALQRMELVWLAALSLLLDLGWLCRGRLKKHKTAVLGVTGIILLVSLPLTVDFLAAGHDLRFHELRIEAVTQGLLRGEFPVRTAPIFNYGTGYASPVFYCDLLLVFPALLRIMGFPIAWAWNGYVLLMNALTAVIGYACFRRLLGDRRAALCADLCWCTAAYRFNNVFVRTALGEYSAMAFLTVVLLAFVRIYDEKDRHTLWQNALLMALGMSMLVMTHILSVEITCLVLAAACLIRFRRTFTRRVLATWLAAAGLTVLLCLWFLVPFLQYYLTVPVMVNQAPAAAVMIQSEGARLADLFDFFKNVYVLWTEPRPLLLTPGLPLMAALAGAAWLMLAGKAEKREKTLTAWSLALLFVSTNLFPWDLISAYLPFGSALCVVQYPWRYLMMVCLFLSVLAGVLLLRVKRKEAAAALCGLCAVMMFLYTGFYNSTGIPVNQVSANDLDTMWVAFSEYSRVLPEEGNTRFGAFGVKEEARGDAQVTETARRGNDVVLQVTAAEEATVDFPLIHYPGFHVTDGTGKEYPVTDSEDCRIRTVVPAGFDGELTLDFRPPLIWRGAEAVSLLTVLLLAAVGLVRRKKHLRRNDEA